LEVTTGHLPRTLTVGEPRYRLLRPVSRLARVKVLEIIRELEEDGWVQVRQVGSHRQFRHPIKHGTVTVPGRMGDELAKGTVGSIVRQAGLARRQR
jgi:predicted RNA binding protein YcfA (HicA-like mRNA interferase family)